MSTKGVSYTERQALWFRDPLVSWMMWKRCLQELLFKVYEKCNYWVVHFLSTQFLSHVNTVCGLHWKAFKKFWASDGDSYANRGKNKLSLIRPTHQALPGPPPSHISPLSFSPGLMVFHLILLFMPCLLDQCLISTLSKISQSSHHLFIRSSPFLLQ